MELLVDIGNTNIKWSSLCCGVLSTPAALRRTTNWYADLFGLWSKLPKPQMVKVGCVAGLAVEDTVALLVSELWQLAPIFVQPRQGLHGLMLAYDNPIYFGVDRWLALLAVHQRGYGPVLVVDCGTAVTLDFLDAHGVHRGGLIVPGLNLLYASLFTGTGIVHTTLPNSIGLLGRNTGECIKFGVTQLIAGLVERVHKQIFSQDAALRLVLTGGDATMVATQLALPCELVPELVLEGLALL